MSLPVIFLSSNTLEYWDWRNPWTKGIGGSETSHIEMAQRLKQHGYNVHSYAPTGIDKTLRGPSGVPWRQCSAFKNAARGVYIFYRKPEELDRPKPKGQIWWFVAQDVDYAGSWTPERLAKVDRYICLCPIHANYTATTYPSIKDRIFVSSNGIRSLYIRDTELFRTDIKRNPNQLFFPSSPDRGLKFLLEQWWRIKEINPKAILNVAYGFNNMEVIWKSIEGDWRKDYQVSLQALLKQPDINFLGRLNQDQIYIEWLRSNIWSHPTDFPETSCITCMEAQALGAWPVTNNLWALRDNVQFGWVMDGIPQNSPLNRTLWLHNLEKAFGSRGNTKERREMQNWALENFDWERIVNQWSKWIDEDFKKCQRH